MYLAKWPNDGCSITNFVNNLNLWSIPYMRKLVECNVAWSTPLEGQVKFNTDGAVVGSYRWVKEISIVFESDCINAVSWLHNPISSSVIFKEIIEACIRLCSNISWSIHAVDRSCNSYADHLAKAGISRGEDRAFLAQIV
ncbi:hypothetical protein V6N12_068759 [Hibiscus sabdariffa]|uniref:RNase H type-1 domain-containing protein n=1 Tax=Hibiscus sabdariffa TaxID=183260 RepID=A0ABR2FR48_9ROSI